MSLRKPHRNPTFEFFEDNCPTDRFHIMEWGPTPERPGMIRVVETVTTKQNFSSSGSDLRDTIANVDELANMGMRQIYESTGIHTWLPRSGPANPQHRFVVAFPTAEQFCQAANEVTQPHSYAGKYEKRGMDAIQFEPFIGQTYSDVDNVRAAARGRLLIATEGLTYHDMLDHAAAALALSREVVCSVQLKAANLLLEISQRNQSTQNHPKIEELNDKLDAIINTRSLLGFLRGDEAKIKTWRGLFRFSNAMAVQHVQTGIHQHIEAMRDTYDGYLE